MHLAVVGVGNVGRSTAFRILTTGLPEELSLVDIKPGLAKSLAEEFKHAAAGMRVDTQINWFDKDEDLSGADIIIISAGFPRPQKVRISRRELLFKNSLIIKDLAEILPERNPCAKYVIVTNPVDAMAMLFKKISHEEFVLSTGNHLETLRFRSKLAEVLGVPRKYVTGYVGGEHGERATVLWSTVRVRGKSLMKFLEKYGKSLNKEVIEKYVKEVPEEVIDYLGATRYGPAVAFTEIIESIALDLNKVLSVSTPAEFNEIPEEVFVSAPTIIGSEIRDKLFNWLKADELVRIREAGKEIYVTYLKALEVSEFKAQ